ncbi:MAG: hypothetical protein B7Z10_04640 [Rhodobacterales bacterium 32-66-7]|nr:MAG: hypothetical protein B7Z31_07085 [Rhodobacterales bacterium 12-65-15]OYX25960.1 MAG: hypothetical protein B7Z10_04640 [Rhodobacterales bacterium 32-66-7]
MFAKHVARTALARAVSLGLGLGLLLTLSACGGGGLFGNGKERAEPTGAAATREQAIERQGGSTLSDLLTNSADPNITVEVNKYIWQASLEVLNFLPIETVDPFTGVIVTGYGRPPGGGRGYRATVYVQDPALDARSLKVALQSQGGGSVAPETVRAVEDAILTRARQLRQRDSRL